MGQCTTLDADVTIGSLVITVHAQHHSYVPFLWNKFFPSHFFASIVLIIKVTASYCIASLIFHFLNFRHVCRVLVCCIFDEYPIPDCGAHPTAWLPE